MKEPEIKLNGWQTIRAVAKEKGCSIQNISQAVKRGDLYEVRVIPELNDLKLIKPRAND